MNKPKIDRETRNWIRNAADEMAARRGCRFDPERGQFVIDFATNYLKLYEGDWAGQPLVPHDWQIEATMRLFSWIRWSDKWERLIRRFRVASIWIPKKNKKSPTLAWWGLYLLCADGEQGQKVFFGAKDGSQAREIAVKHAVEMVYASDDLLEVCTVNKTLAQITHEPTRSILRPVSSADAKSQKAKEGINGSLLIDETHVVDRRFMDRVKRAGISRSEPLQIEASTVGDDDQSYGFSQWDYGNQVNSGAIDDDQFLFMHYGIPDETTDAQIIRSPVKFGRMANPAWGTVIDKQEFRTDLNSSKQSRSEFGMFKMYRLNQWQRTSNPWLLMDRWDDCGSAFKLEDLEGEHCCAGLDLSKTRDMSSLVLAFKFDEVVSIVPFFWFPENVARDKSHLANYLDWIGDGHLWTIPGDVIDQRFILRDIRDKILPIVTIDQLAYDPMYAEELTATLEDEDGIERIEFPQRITEFAEPTADFERMVIGGELEHNRNPVMSWQAGHAQVRIDVNANKRPVKPNDDTHKKIDGIVAAIMAVSRALVFEPDDTESVYKRRGVLTVK